MLGRRREHRSDDAPRLLAPFRVAEFRAMWAAETLSNLGDQLARVALAVLVFDRTGSAALTGLTYALTFVPSLVGGILLGHLGDRYPRRTVLVTVDAARAVLIGLAAIPGLPLWVLGALVAAMTLLNGPFRGAQQAALPDVLAGDIYPAGLAVRNTTLQAAQLIGFAGGGALVAGLNPRAGLLIDAFTFAVSAALLRARMRPHVVPAAPEVSFLHSTAAAVRLVAHDRQLRLMLAVAWLAGFYIVPEALAAPYAAALGGGAGTVGLLMASDPAGSVLGGVLFGKWAPQSLTIRTLGLLGALAGAPLVGCFVRPGLAVSMLLFALSGLVATGYSIHATGVFVRALPDSMRAQGSGLLVSGAIAVQGLGALLAGVLADYLDPHDTVAVAGLGGIAMSLLVVRGSRAVRPDVVRDGARVTSGQ